MRPIVNTYTVIASSSAGVCASQTPSGAGALTLDGSLISDGMLTLSTPQHISVSCAGSDAAKTFTVTGTDFTGAALSENIAGSAGSITNGTKNFKTVTSVTVSAATAGAVTVGVLGVLETPWIPLNFQVTPFNYSYQVDIGTATFTVEGTLDNTQDSSLTPTPFTVQSSGSADVTGSATAPVTAVRVKVTAFTSGTITFRVLQAGI